MNFNEDLFTKALGSDISAGASGNFNLADIYGFSRSSNVNPFIVLPTIVHPEFHHNMFQPRPMYFPQSAQFLPPSIYDYNWFARYMQSLSLAGRTFDNTSSGNTTIIGYQYNQAHPSGPATAVKNPEPTVSANAARHSTDAYDTGDIPIISLNGQLSQLEQLVQLTRIAMKGCDLAENLANYHKKRPCFKKIDSLAARLKQDLVRPDNVLANINSQGIAWAVKDFIFVFTRIINAWLIIKGYVYNTPMGLGNVKAALAPNFNECFAKWQEITLEFVDNLIKSFISLDQLVQNQRVATSYKSHRSAPNSVSSSSSTSQSSPFKLQDFDLNDNEAASSDWIEGLHDGFGLASTQSSSNVKNQSPPEGNAERDIPCSVVPNSEDKQRKHFENGTYFKTEEEPLGLDTASSQNTTESSSAADDNDNTVTELADDCKSIDQAKADEKESVAEATGKNPSMPIGLFIDPAMVKKSDYLLQRICELDEAQYFFAFQFTKNYFPDFQTIVPDFIDIRSIILKNQIGDYNDIYEIVKDLYQIIQSGRNYLEKKSHSLMEKSVEVFEIELAEILDEALFANYDFTGIVSFPCKKTV